MGFVYSFWFVMDWFWQWSVDSNGNDPREKAGNAGVKGF